MIFSKKVTTPVGDMLLTEENGALTGAALARFSSETGSDTPLLLQAEAEIKAYFSGELRVFSVPLAMKGTPFQQMVWQALREIPYGQTATYGEIAARIGRPLAARAVGMACNRNPLLLFVPCHRVVGTGGKLTGFAAGIQVKEELLQVEAEGYKIDNTQGEVI